MKEYGQMNENTVKILEEAFSNGASDIEACFLANISKQTLYNYQKKHPDYVDRKEALKDMVKYRAKQKIRKAIETEKKPETSKWYLERKDNEFKTKTDITTDNKPLPILTDALHIHDSDKENIPDEKKDKSSTGGDSSVQDG